MMRKNHSPAFKAKIVIEALRETKPLTQIAAENQIHPTLVTKWKTEALHGLHDLFERGNKRDQMAQDHEKQVAELYQEIGRLTTKVNWLKKKSGLDPDAQ
jgi:putative transposase